MVSGKDFRELRESLGESQKEFGWTLKRAVDPGARYPYTRQYVSGIENGRVPVTKELEGAYGNIAGAVDEMPAGLGGAVRVSVYAGVGAVPEGTFIPLAGKVALCARPGCGVRFLKVNPLQRYHHPSCGKGKRNGKSA